MAHRWRASLAAALAGTSLAVALTGSGLARAATGPGADALSPTELTWLRAAAPVLAFARAERLPLHVLVQPQDTPGQTPIGMAFIEGRCVLVLSMRGNPEAQATLDRMPPGLLGPVVEAIAAHELGHCWRHLQQTWGTLPSGLMELSGFSQVTPEQEVLLKDMWRTRREEGFADLVGLAWTLQHHPQHYAAVHAWHVRERAEQAVDTGPHDTRVWIRLAEDPAAFGPGGSVFERVAALWQAGLIAGF
ncbi:hypothetical protein [Pseudaquabacterium pictum]|uniref:Peptidase M48 domain-containing protein n=1 Tax=Pseudaquabacterium pictum TaxID=2315236 RepID=A0A480AS27_9BURK|nr:hypothetical protein [Rubrivivax pictus]GCL63746.1 hypothetical protein AQPW35_28270 [Rubrivivax pictus]